MSKLLKLTFGLVFLLAGCGPVISQQYIKEAASRVDVAALKAQPEKYQGQLVILGGEIVENLRKKDQSLLTINQKELDVKLRPLDADAYGGIFLVESNSWLEPDTYVPNRKITVAGVVVGQQNGVPLLQARQIYLWEHPFKLIAVPPEWYGNDPAMEYWYTPPYYDPWRNHGAD
jgi:outer membrane lipoprotein